MSRRRRKGNVEKALYKDYGPFKGWFWLIILLTFLMATQMATAPLQSMMTTAGYQPGSTVLSIDKVEYSSVSEFWNGPTWIVTVRGGGRGDYFELTLSPDELERLANEDGAPDMSELTMKFKTYDSTCIYPVRNLPKKYYSNDLGQTFMSPEQQVYTLNAVTGNRKWGESNTDLCKRLCGSLPVFDCLVTKYGGYLLEPQKAVCGVQRTGSVGYLDSPDIVSRMEVTAYGSEVFGIDTREGHTQGYVDDSIFVIWNGGLDSGRSCPSESPYRPMYGSDGRWEITSEDGYDRYVSYVVSKLDGIVYLDKYVDTWNSYANDAMSGAGFGIMKNKESEQGAVVEHDSGELLHNPHLTIYLRADKITDVVPYHPVGKFAIVSSGSRCFESGADGTIEVNIKNVGDEVESGEVRIENLPDEFEPVRTSYSVSIDPGKIRLVTFQIGADVSEEVINDAVIVADGDGGVAEATVELCVLPHQVCTPGSESCDTKTGHTFKCNEMGSAWVLDEECDYGCELKSSGNAVCKSKDDDGDSSWWTGLFGGWFGSMVEKLAKMLQNVFGIPGWQAGMVATLILLLLAFVFAFFILMKFPGIIGKWAKKTPANPASASTRRAVDQGTVHKHYY